jgi:hypothetical protein
MAILPVDGSIALAGAGNLPPVASAQSVTTAEDTAKSIQLAADDGNPEVAQELTFAIVDYPDHGTLAGFDAMMGQVIYRPAADCYGSDSFAFTVTDDDLAGAPANLSP